MVLDDGALFIACGDIGVTIAGSSIDLNEPVLAVAVETLGC